MIPRGRGRTRAGRPATQPGKGYEPPSVVRHTPTGNVVDIHGEDGRTLILRIDRLPLTGWHRPLAAAFAERAGPAGGLRTAGSVHSTWECVARFVRFLNTLAAPPASPADLTVAQLDAFQRDRVQAVGQTYAWREVRRCGLLLRCTALRTLVSADVLDYACQRGNDLQLPPKTGYSDNEFDRQLVPTARSDVANIRNRIRAGERLLTDYLAEPDSIDLAQHEHAAQIVAIAESGVVPRPAGSVALTGPRRQKIAGDLFLTRADMAPLLVLFVAVTGCNVETIKELPVEHRILDGRAVELRIIKRRRGQQRWFQTVTWEIGAPSRQLHTPGGLYLLAHELTGRSRAFSQTPRLWSIWRDGQRAGVTGRAEHYGLFDQTLDTQLRVSSWARSRNLVADTAPPAESAEEAPRQPLRVDFTRLKSSVDVRRAKQLGGHLPSAARTNTIPVLFRHYLRGDPTVIEWAHDILGDAVADAEQAALTAHRRALGAAGGALHVLTERSTSLSVGDAQDSAWTACRDHDRHPATGAPCRESFLDCFHCGNCVVTHQHLPRLLSLLDALSARREQLSEQDWWARYGMAWAAIREDILAKFTPAELDEAAAGKPKDALLDLVENPWEHP